MPSIRCFGGLEAAERHPELRPIKVNCVAIKGFTEDEVPALAGLARRKPYVVRFIEFMPLDADQSWRWEAGSDRRRDPLPLSSAIGGSSSSCPPNRPRPPSALPSPTEWRLASSTRCQSRSAPPPATVSASPRTASCAPASSRGANGTEEPLRTGASQRTSSRTLIRGAVRHKELKHRVNEPGFVPASPLDVPDRGLKPSGSGAARQGGERDHPNRRRRVAVVAVLAASAVGAAGIATLGFAATTKKLSAHPQGQLKYNVTKLAAKPAR